MKFFPIKYPSSNKYLTRIYLLVLDNLMPRGSGENLRFIWFSSPDDFEKCKKYVSDLTSVPDSAWTYFDDNAKCVEFIKQERKKKIYLIASGTRLKLIIDDIHSFNQLDSIYIYCRKPNNYELLKLNYEKIRSIHDNPITLCDEMCQIVQLKRANSCITEEHTDLLCIVKNEIKSYSIPNIFWSPWETNSCTRVLSIKGQGTIEIWLKGPISFEIRLSTNNDEYAIVLNANYRKVELGTIDKRQGSTFHVRDDTIECHQVVQTNNQHWYCYWLSFSSENRIVQYGLGEVRPRFKILEVQLPEQDKSLIERISHLHIKINDKTDANALIDLNDKIKIFIGEEPILFEPPLLVISPAKFSRTHCENYFGLHGKLLPNPLAYLYQECLNFNLIDEQFPDFIKAIERSIRNPNGWCHEKLSKKIDYFGPKRERATYLCLLIKQYENQSSLIMKIWPSDHHTPVHEYENTYSIIHIVHGELFVKYFPILSIHHPQDTVIERMFERDSVIWMTPKLNHIVQMKNLEKNNPSCCITIECVHHMNDKQFAFLSSRESKIEYYNCEPDDSYSNFKETMQNEWREENKI